MISDRSESVGKISEEKSIDEGRGIWIKKKTLYRGSGIGKLELAHEYTVGEGVYLTSGVEQAEGYARRRSEYGGATSPTVYEVSVEDIRLLDLRDDQNVKSLMVGFRDTIKKELEQPGVRWNYQANLLKAVEVISSGKVGGGNLADVTRNIGELFGGYCESLGYDGLITLEGGEGDIGNHDSYVIFDPGKVKVIREVKLDGG